jgi:hypothetical protein
MIVFACGLAAEVPSRGAAQGLTPTSTPTPTPTLTLTPPPTVAPASAPTSPSLLLRPPEAPGPAGYALRQTAGGGYTYQDEGWRAAIAPDGTVEFHDRPIALTNFRLGPVDLARGMPSGRPTLQGAVRDALRPRPAPDPWAEARAPIWKYHADPREACQRQRDACYFVPVGASGAPLSVGGLMDLTDAYMRWMKQDPYRPAKARFLAATFEMRMKMASRHQTALLRQTLADLPARLEALWADPSWPPVEKRQVIWSFWNEAGDDEAGRAVRVTIERFVRARLPQGTQDAFTDAELARFGAAAASPASASSPSAPPARRFAPYAAPDR